ncbi:virulence-associated E family protein [Alsobacter soli]|uniref:virulence-associated E family protein n=1 Tax=Alsobacter soli TaxID=2109933 RepID=UPI0013048D52|nr:virulence-associated E family protein [Alsobacter soli]
MEDLVSEEWKDKLLRSNRKDAQPLRSVLANAYIALLECPELVGLLAFDEFNQAVVLTRDPPWTAIDRQWTEHNRLCLTVAVQRLGLDVQPNAVAEAALVVARANPVHPVREYLKGLVWDGRERTSAWLSTYFGAEHSPYVAAVGRKFLISAVARIMEPGCKVDTMLILEGDQGIGKSTAIKVLAGEDWFTDSMPPKLNERDAAIQLRGKFIIEMAELSVLARANDGDSKGFLSRAVDDYRPVYGRTAEKVPRQCVFIGTTNSDEYLRDATGARRFWPVACNKVDLVALAADRDQLWAEALALYKAGNQWHLTEAEEALARGEQKQRYAADPWSQAIDEYLVGKHRVTVDDVLSDALDVKRAYIRQSDKLRVSKHLKANGWHRGKSDGTRYYTRVGAPDALVIPHSRGEVLSDGFFSNKLDRMLCEVGVSPSNSVN